MNASGRAISDFDGCFQPARPCCWARIQAFTDRGWSAAALRGCYRPVPSPPIGTTLAPPRLNPCTGDGLMEYRRQVAMQRDGDDFVIAFEPDGFIIFRNKDADALRKLCRSLRWEIVSDVTSSADEPAWSLVPAQSDPAETTESDPAKTDAD